MTKVVHDTDIGTGLEISGGKLNAAATMATDAEVAAAILGDNAVEAQAKLRADYLRRVQQHLTTTAIFEVYNSSLKFSPDDSSLDAAGGRILAMGAGEGTHAGNEGYFNIFPPTSGTVINGLGISDSVVDSNGFITFPPHGNLYYQLPAGGSSNATQGTWYMSAYNSGDYTVTDDLLLIAQQQPNIPPSGMFQLWDGRQLFQGKNYTDTGWIDMIPYLAAGVSVFGGGYQTPRFRRLNNRVYVEGIVSLDITTPKLLATLPAGFIPALAHIYITDQSGYTPVRIDVQTSGGIVQVTGSTYTWVSLAGINFGLD